MLQALGSTAYQYRQTAIWTYSRSLLHRRSLLPQVFPLTPLLLVPLHPQTPSFEGSSPTSSLSAAGPTKDDLGGHGIAGGDGTGLGVSSPADCGGGARFVLWFGGWSRGRQLSCFVGRPFWMTCSRSFSRSQFGQGSSSRTLCAFVSLRWISLDFLQFAALSRQRTHSAGRSGSGESSGGGPAAWCNGMLRSLGY